MMEITDETPREVAWKMMVEDYNGRVREAAERVREAEKRAQCEKERVYEEGKKLQAERVHSGNVLARNSLLLVVLSIVVWSANWFPRGLSAFAFFAGVAGVVCACLVRDGPPSAESGPSQVEGGLAEVESPPVEGVTTAQ